MSARVARYLAEQEVLFARWPLHCASLAAVRQVVVIPCLGEEESLFETLRLLSHQPAVETRGTLVICVVNNGAPGSDVQVQAWAADNLRTLKRLNDAAHRSWHNGGARVAYVDAATPGQELPPREGVGLARKIGLDWGLRVLAQNGVTSGALVSLDADTAISGAYLCAARMHFQRGDAWAALYPVAHLMTEEQGGGIALYEIFLRAHALGLAFAGSPYAYLSVGSAMACSGEAYAAVGGMRQKQAGEDFYFLQALAKGGRIALLTGAAVHPSVRISTRVPFGTGRALWEAQEKGRNLGLVYAPEVFAILKRWFDVVMQPEETTGEELHAAGAAAHPELGVFLARQDFAQVYDRLAANARDRAALAAQFWRWFDAFRCLKAMHHLRDHGFPMVDWRVGLRALLRLQAEDLRAWDLSSPAATVLALRSYEAHVRPRWGLGPAGDADAEKGA